MADQHFYYTIEKPSTAEFKDRGSRFIAYAYPLNTADEFKKIIQQLRKEHPKAAHHCFAYRIGCDGNNFRSSDDGEPSGTAGKPILGQIDSKQITNVAIIVIRYWGGTLLGVPGLINAYKTAASLALQVTPIVKKQIEAQYIIEFNYTQINEVMMILKQFSCTIIPQEIQLFCSVTAGIPLQHLQQVLHKIGEMQSVTAKQSP